MSIAYDCVAIWVGECGRNLLLDVLFEDYGITNAKQSQMHQARALFVYPNSDRMFWSNGGMHSLQDVKDYMDKKHREGRADTYRVIDYPHLVKVCREELR